MRINAFSTIRLIVMLRRLWKSVDRLADIEHSRLKLEQDRMALDFPKWQQAGQKLPPASGKRVELGVAKVEDWNKRWDVEHGQE